MVSFRCSRIADVKFAFFTLLVLVLFASVFSFPLQPNLDLTFLSCLRRTQKLRNLTYGRNLISVMCRICARNQFTRFYALAGVVTGDAPDYVCATFASENGIPPEFRR